MTIITSDITFEEGKNAYSDEQSFKCWRQALFQDMQESNSTQIVYFLYDPQADEECATTGPSKGGPGLVIFSTELRRFVRKIDLNFPGSLKFLFSLKCPSLHGGSCFVLVTEEYIFGRNRLNVYRLDMSTNGLYLVDSRPLLMQPVEIIGEYICTLRNDAPELVVLGGSGLQIYRINCLVDKPSFLAEHFFIHQAELSHFYDGFLHNGVIYLLSATPDGNLDWTRIHTINLNEPQTITTHNCYCDPTISQFPCPRKQAAIDSTSKGIVVAGGEFISEYGEVCRLCDYWILDLKTYQWKLLPGEMPCGLIEPRLTVCNSGNIYIWGDYDVFLNGLSMDKTHIRILKITGIENSHTTYTEKLLGFEKINKINYKSNPHVPLMKNEEATDSFHVAPYPPPKPKKKSGWNCCNIN